MALPHLTRPRLEPTFAILPKYSKAGPAPPGLSPPGSESKQKVRAVFKRKHTHACLSETIFQKKIWRRVELCFKGQRFGNVSSMRQTTQYAFYHQRFIGTRQWRSNASRKSGTVQLLYRAAFLKSDRQNDSIILPLFARYQFIQQLYGNASLQVAKGIH